GWTPILVGESICGVNHAINQFADYATQASASVPADFNARLLFRSADESIAAANELPFDKWLNHTRDRQLQSDLKLAEAKHYESLGQNGLAKVMYDWAEGILRFPAWTFTPSDHSPLPPEERMAAQFSPLSIRTWDPDTKALTIPSCVSVLFCPTPKPCEIPAYTFFATDDGVIPPQVHTAFLTWLHERYGADIIAIVPRIIEVIPKSRPTEWESACRLAADIRSYAQCTINSSSEVDTLEQWASYLIDSTVWSLCWL
ncbi:MAG: DUF4253 domain-containing protein, partial [Planctomycetaceae bacterium]